MKRKAELALFPISNQQTFPPHLRRGKGSEQRERE
uniref:Uncharacterized protein n=1 Tax=Anguilla anguilla TaxID=7936 RepID=A0A0E9R2E0_ANGAN